MAILGSIIKTAIDLRGAIVSEKSPVESQREVLKNLLEKAKETAFGKYYGFAHIRKLKKSLPKKYLILIIIKWRPNGGARHRKAWKI